MTNYVWAATDKSGRKVIKEIEAANAEDAKYILLAQGYADLELKEDEVISAANAGFSDRPTMFGEELRVTAEERLKHRDDPTDTFWAVLRKGLGQSLGGCVAVILFTGYNLYRGNYISALLLVVAMFAWLAFLLCLGLPSVYYRKLIQAMDWSRWNEALSLVQTLKAIERISLIKVPATELTRNRAIALVGLGDLLAGLAEFKQCEGRPDCPGWLYQLFVGGLYSTAKQYDKSIECNLAAIAEKPTSTAYLDLANRYARYKKDPVKARAAMAEAEKTPLVDITKPFHVRCLGIIAYLEKDFATARRHLESAIEMVEPAKGRPFRDGHLGVTRAYLSCVLARQGDVTGARQCLAQAKAYLIATEEDELLAECRELCAEHG